MINYNTNNFNHSITTIFIVGTTRDLFLNRRFFPTENIYFYLGYNCLGEVLGEAELEFIDPISAIKGCTCVSTFGKLEKSLGFSSIDFALN